VARVRESTFDNINFICGNVNSVDLMVVKFGCYDASFYKDVLVVELLILTYDMVNVDVQLFEDCLSNGTL
jgi:hypothetical protein